MEKPTKWDGRREAWESARYPVDIATTEIPFAVTLDPAGEGLFWTREGSARREALQAKSPRKKLRLLLEFMALAEAPAQRIVVFADTWGALEICEHDLPASHNPASRVLFGEPAVSPCAPRTVLESPYRYHVKPAYHEDAPRFHWESLERWRHFSGQAGLIYRLGLQLRGGKPGAAEDWDALDGATYDLAMMRALAHAKGYEPLGVAKTVKIGKMALADRVQQWLEWGGIQPRFAWEEAAPHLSLDPLGLFGLLAMHLALAISQIDGLATCTECGNPYIPARKPRAGQRHYCEACKASGADRRHANDRYYERERAKAGATVRHGREHTPSA